MDGKGRYLDNIFVEPVAEHQVRRSNWDQSLPGRGHLPDQVKSPAIRRVKLLWGKKPREHYSNPLTEIDSSVFTDPANLERLELPLTTHVPSPATTLSPASNEEWVCSENQHFVTCSVRTGARQ